MGKRTLLHRIINHVSRYKIFNFLSDEKYLKIKYWARTGNKLNLSNPQTFNEKLQWLKLYDRKSEYTTMVDKYEAKKYVADKIGEEYIIPTLGVYDTFDEINFDELPNQFVMKCTHDSGGLVICRDKNKFNKAEAKKKVEKSLKRNYYYAGREWPYKNVKPRIIIEKYMEDSASNDLKDYKFYCFNGIPKLIYVAEGLENHATAKRSFLNMDWTFAPFSRSDYVSLKELPKKPLHYEEMIKIAETLSIGKKFLRVDLYEINGKVYFGELTFTPCSGLMPFEPEEWDYKLGELITLPTK